MPDSLFALLPHAVTWLATYLLHSTLLLAGTWLALRLFRLQSHALTERLWKLAAVLPLVTTALQLTADFSNPVANWQLSVGVVWGDLDSASAEADGRLNAIREANSTIPFETSSALPDERFASVDQAARSHLLAGPMKTQQASDAEVGVFTDSSGFPAAAPSAKQRESLDTGKRTAEVQRPNIAAGQAVAWILVVAAAGAISLAIGSVLKLVLQTCAFHRRIVRCRPITSGLVRSLLDELLIRTSIDRNVSLLSSAKYPEPVAFGVFRWRIVLPVGIEQNLSRDELKALLGHELAHLVRGDAIWLWIGHILCSCFAFQPLNFLARRAWQRAGEFQCDDWAVRQTDNALSLARCLTLVAEWRLNAPVCSTTLAAGGPESDLSSRVCRLIEGRSDRDPWDKPLRKRFLKVAAIGIAAAIAAWGPRTTLLARPTGELKIVQDTAARPTSMNHPRDREETASPRPIDEELNTLRDELQLLERDVRRLNLDLEQETARPGMSNLSKRLRRQIAKLKDRYEFLSAMLDDEVKTVSKIDIH